MRSYDNRGPCFLAEPSWRRLSRDLAKHPSLQSTLSDESEEVFHTFVDLPGFIHPAVDYIDSQGKMPPNCRNSSARGIYTDRNMKCSSNLPTMHSKMLVKDLPRLLHPRTTSSSLLCINFLVSLLALSVVAIGPQ